MNISVETPQILWLLLLNLVFIGVPMYLKKKQSYFYIGLRILVLTLLVLGASGLQWTATADETHTIFLVDGSASVGAYKETVETYITDQLDLKDQKDYVEIIAFAESLGIEQLMTKTPMPYQQQVVLNRGGTNLEEAFSFAIERFDQDKNKRLVLVSDFKETSGQLIEKLTEGIVADIEFKHLALEGQKIEDVQLLEVEMPTKLRQGERFPVAISVYSDLETTGTLMIYSDDQIAVQREVTLEPGIQRYVFEDQLFSSGGHQYVARIEVFGDRQPENNQWQNIVEVEGPPQLLVIDPQSEGDLFVEILKKQGIQVSHYNKSDVHHSLEALVAYDGVVLINASIETLGTDFLGALDLYVKELGGGLLTIGGGESYAVGGYEETILEQILPVNMALELEGQRYDLAMMVVVDKSGSMSAAEQGPSKMQMAKEAVLRVAKTLKGQDQLGLIAFDGRAHEVFPLTQASDLETISAKVAGVKADGGTSILPALEMGLEGMAETSLKGKHLLLVSDGQGEQAGYEHLIAQYPDVTISTISIGQDSDVKTMKRIAEAGHGRHYLVTDYRKIPEIFTKETRLAMDEFIKEGTFVPERNSLHSVVENIRQLPLLYGYVSTTAKPQSELILSIEDEPLLVSWQYGLGKTMAWTSDANAWTRAYYGQDQGVQFLVDMATSSLSTLTANHFDISSSVVNNKLFISGLIPEDESVVFEVMSSDGQNIPLDLTTYSDGYFERSGLVPESGFVFLRGVDREENKLVYQGPLAINYSKEYDALSQQKIKDAYVSLTGSKSLSIEAPVFTEIVEKSNSTKNFGALLLILALCLFVIDVACRKLRFDPIQRIMSKRVKEKRMAVMSDHIRDEIEIDKGQRQEKMVEKEQDSSVLDTSRLLSKKRKREL